MSYVMTIDAEDGQIVLRDRQIISVGPEHQAAGGEVPNMSVELDNARGQHTRLFARPPLGATATLADTTGATLFAGRVQSVTCSGTITVELEA